MNKRQKNTLISTVVVIAVLIITAVTNRLPLLNSSETADKAVNEANAMTASFIDVGQGDCELISFPDGSCMLIDCGEERYADSVEQRLRQDGYTRIDTLIVTHPHTDHMGGMSRIISDFDIGEIYMPRVISNTEAYKELLEVIDDKGMTINTARAGEKITFSEDITGEFLAPVSDSYEDMNNYSAVLKLTYNEVSFLFTGDAEKLSEDEMLDNYYSELDADVLKVGHHGSRYSSSEGFLEAVSPQYAVIECGENNKYGHPHNETLLRLEDCGAVIYRTDLNGDISFVTDGTAIEIGE